MLEIFCRRMRVARDAAKITQSDLAKKVGSTRSTISGYEADGKEPDYSTLLKICRALDVSADYLLGLTDNPSHRSTNASAGSVDAYRRSTESLPKDLRSSALSVLDNACALAYDDVEKKDPKRIKLYSRLLSVLSSQRSAVRSCVEQSGGVMDVSAMAEIMSLQSELKSTVSTLLDELLQSDLESLAGSSGKKEEAGDTGYLDGEAM